MWCIAEFVASFQILLTTMAPSRTQELFMISQLSKWCSKLKCQFVNSLHNIGRTFLYFPINHRRRRRGQKGITVNKKNAASEDQIVTADTVQGKKSLLPAHFVTGPTSKPKVFVSCIYLYDVSESLWRYLTIRCQVSAFFGTPFPPVQTSLVNGPPAWNR